LQYYAPVSRGAKLNNNPGRMLLRHDQGDHGVIHISLFTTYHDLLYQGFFAVLNYHVVKSVRQWTEIDHFVR
jgi:hypothetical protein